MLQQVLNSLVPTASYTFSWYQNRWSAPMFMFKAGWPLVWKTWKCQWKILVCVNCLLLNLWDWSCCTNVMLTLSSSLLLPSSCLFCHILHRDGAFLRNIHWCSIQVALTVYACSGSLETLSWSRYDSGVCLEVCCLGLGLALTVFVPSLIFNAEFTIYFVLNLLVNNFKILQ